MMTKIRCSFDGKVRAGQGRQFEFALSQVLEHWARVKVRLARVEKGHRKI